ncbi:5'-3' exonuclease [Bacillus thermotolerans]|uniref:5'-3' exonuclease n=1 Tax=Bacillus thermotolerans TaxID=1221996 RepID=A0A0F5HXC9_BACTR|nr:5'-3' exonuclease [Bacillus thermotolerans]KKB37695.1 DNA polymerase I [Bacillus thermotolerans]KKB38509.1 DNA polymerase I [Bacillus thermotolerans]
MKKEEHLLLVDGMALLFRAFFATAVRGQYMRNSSGLPTNGVQGFLKHVLLAAAHKQPTHLAVCWDMGSYTFRNDLFADYKSNRQAPPDELHPQFDLAKEAAAAFGLPNVGVPGYEADDCLGTIAKQEHKERKVTILSGDRDLLQLLDDQLDVMLLQKGYGNYITYTAETFYEQFAISPRQFIDVKALMGDPSDGYPGVKGIGEKTAFKLIKEYGSIEGILANIDQLTPSQQKKMSAGMNVLELSRQLAEIHCEVPVLWHIEEARWRGVEEEAVRAVEEMELHMLRRQLIQMNVSMSIKDIDDPFSSI